MSSDKNYIGVVPVAVRNYFNLLASFSGGDCFGAACGKKTSELNLVDSNEVFIHSRFGVDAEQIFVTVHRTYDRVSKKLIGLIKSHLNTLALHFSEKTGYYKLKETEGLPVCKGLSECPGDLNFLKPSIFLKQKTDDIAQYSDPFPITTGNSDLAYMFFMFRKVMGDKAEVLLPTFVITASKESDTQYTDNDLLKFFEYQIAGASVEAYITTSEGLRMDPGAKIVFRSNLVEVRGVVKNAFYYLNLDCNILRTAPVSVKTDICKGASDSTNPDHFIEYMVCMEIFNMATDAALCPHIEYVPEVI